MPSKSPRLEIRLEWDPEAEVWVSYVPLLNDLSTYGKTLEEVTEMTQEAILGYLETAEKLGKTLPLGTEEIRSRVEAQAPVGLEH